MRYIKDDYGYMAIFDENSGYTIRAGESGKDPFWKESGPELLDISITNYCEKNCNFCYRNSNRSGKHMSLDLYEKILQNAKKAGVFQIALGGGNPNQHPYFVEILRMTREYGIVPSYTTNGQGMTTEIYEATREYGGALAVSWYYPYDDAKKVIETGHSYGIPINIHYVLDAESIQQVGDLFDKGQLDYVNAIIFLNYKPVGSGKRTVLEKGNLISVFMDEMLQYKKCQIGFDSCMISHLVNKQDIINMCSIDYCEAGRFSAFISEAGDMYPCSFMCGAGMQGNSIIVENMEIIWKKSKNFIDIRNAIKNPKKEKCRKCYLFTQCHGGCPIFDINCK